MLPEPLKQRELIPQVLEDVKFRLRGLSLFRCQLTRVGTRELAAVTKHGRTGLIEIGNAGREPVPKNAGSGIDAPDEEHWVYTLSW